MLCVRHTVSIQFIRNNISFDNEKMGGCMHYLSVLLWGPKGPLFINPSRGFLHIDGSSKLNKIASTIIFGPMVLIVHNCKYFPTTTCGWFYPSNPQSQSRRLLSICIVLFVLAYFVCFLGALACGFFL